MKLEKGAPGERDDRYASSPALAGAGLRRVSAPLPRYTSTEHLQQRQSSESDEAQPAPQPPPPPQVPLQNGGVGVSLGTPCPLEDQHQGKELINTVLPLPIDVVFNLIFRQEQFMIDVYTIKKTYDVVYNPWEDHEEGYRNRVVTYTMTLPSANLGPKVSYVTEKQTVQSQSRAGEVYVIEFETFNSGIPYADAFYVFSHYCLTKEDENLTRLTVWGSVKYKKSVWSFMKSVIEKNTYSGMEALLAEISVQVASQGDKMANPKTTKRRRRPNAPRHAPIPTQTKTQDKDGGGLSWLPVVVLTSITVLVATNVVLYTRLASLEKQSAHSITHTASPPPRVAMAGSWEDVARILQRQDQLHKYQMDQWKDRLTQAAHTLSQVENWLEDILASIPEQEERLREALTQHISKLQQAWTPHAHTQDPHTHTDQQHSCTNQDDMQTQHDVGQNDSQQHA